MIIIVEGADLVGKTTLIDGLISKCHWPVIKLRWDLLGDPEIETRAMAKATSAFLASLRPNVILDRSYFSWWAYAAPLGYNDSYMPEVISTYKPAESTRLILLTASAGELKRRFEVKPDAYFPLDVIQKANERYPSLLPLLPMGIKSISIDTTNRTIDQVLQVACEFLFESSNA